MGQTWQLGSRRCTRVSKNKAVSVEVETGACPTALWQPAGGREEMGTSCGNKVGSFSVVCC